MDDINLSDAILLALHRHGWIGALRRKDAPAQPAPRVWRKAETRRPAALLDIPTKRGRGRPKKEERSISLRKLYPRPEGVTPPPGVNWKPSSGRWGVQVSIQHKMHYVCYCLPTQEGADQAGELLALARKMRDDGADIDEIRTAVKEARRG